MALQNIRARIGQHLRDNKLLIVVELLIAASFVVMHMRGVVPTETPFILLIGWLSLWLRGVGWRGVGLRRPASWKRTLLIALFVGIVFQFASLYALEPLLARFTGKLPDVSQFASLVGNPVLLLIWLAVAWTLAAFGEEMVFRGYLMNRLADVGNRTRAAWVFALIVVTLAFGLAHLYQGASGVIATALSGLIFGLVYLADGRNLWSAILAHGIYDTIGFVLIYLGKYPGL